MTKSKEDINQEYRDKLSVTGQENFDKVQVGRIVKELNGIESSNPKHAEVLNKINNRITNLEKYFDEVESSGSIDKAAEDIVNQVDKQLLSLSDLEINEDTESAKERLTMLRNNVLETQGHAFKQSA